MRAILQFVRMNLENHCKKIVEFRRDSFVVSFGDDSGFDEESYLRFAREKMASYPEGFVLVKENNKYIGQLELSIRKYEGKYIGYVHLCYLIPEERGKGKGRQLHDYAKQFFENNNVHEFHLRVSPHNPSAINFYRKIGMSEIGPEINGKVVRMRAYI